MDSLTQIALGAAVAEITLGKKIGNKAIFWGAVAGTIPDLDILANGFMSPLDALATHRGISHSFVFAILASLGLGPLVQWIYKSKHHHWVALCCWAIFFLSMGIPVLFSGIGNAGKLIAIVVLGLILFSLYRKYSTPSHQDIGTTSRDWTRLFFWSIVTHPILDCFTTYGTQLFQPFSNYRVGFNNISVADPLYTIPLIIALVLLSRLPKANNNRRNIMWIGVLISSLYMCLTFWNKSRINQVFENTLAKENISYDRYMTSPTILNNVLWFCLAERKDEYVFGLYSFFDSKKEVQLSRINKNWQLLDAKESDPVIQTLSWFSNGFYAVMKRKDGQLQINDMRYGTFNGDATNEESYIFRFGVEKNQTGDYIMTDDQAGPPNEERGDMLTDLWTRIKGI